MKRAPGHYWVALARWCGVPTIAFWTGERWCKPADILCPGVRVRKVLSGRLAPPEKGWIPLPVDRVLLDTGKGYREELKVDCVNHATGAVYVSRRPKP